LADERHRAPARSRDPKRSRLDADPSVARHRVIVASAPTEIVAALDAAERFPPSG